MRDAPIIRSVVARLSPSAQDALQEVVDDYRARLLEQVELDHPDGNITGIDLLRSVYADPSAADSARLAAELSNIDEAIAYREYLQRRATVRSVFLVGGAAVFAAAAAILPALIPAMGDLNIAVVGGALAGVIALATLAVLNNVRADRGVKMARDERRLVEHEGLSRQLPPSDRVGTKDGTSSFGATAEFLEGWNEIEHLLAVLAEYTLDSPPEKRLPFSAALKQVSDLHVLSNIEVQTVRELLTIRNDLVHGELPRNYYLEGSLVQVDQVIGTLRTAIDRVRPGVTMKRGRNFVDKFLASDAAKQPLPRVEDRDN